MSSLKNCYEIKGVGGPLEGLKICILSEIDSNLFEIPKPVIPEILKEKVLTDVTTKDLETLAAISRLSANLSPKLQAQMNANLMDAVKAVDVAEGVSITV